ncbi:MAG: gliding motility-associated C-terminal domain-containing protein [Saprospiraceae bacterium]|nr:gliding motility-associated C-terminal domain-containing protein [Saprospiraceae bacterium]
MKFHVFGIFVFVPVTLFFLPTIQAQSGFPITDCLGAQVLCSDSSVVFIPQGYGINDFADPRNDQGCLTNFEVQSAWYYFEFRRNMPRNSKLQFSIIPTGSAASGATRDFDFALYGPNLSCDSLGSPLRCSETYGPGQPTGLDSMATGDSERGTFPEEDGMVSDLTVQPGEGYFLLLNNWDMSASEFKIVWGGAAAPWLNCRATPGCDPLPISAGPDTVLCQSGQDQEWMIRGDTSGLEGGEDLFWTGVAGTTSWLSDSLSLTPVLTIPGGFSGSLNYVLHVGYGNCFSTDTVHVRVYPAPESPLPRDTFFCAGDQLRLDGSLPGLRDYRWSDGSTEPAINIAEAGLYVLEAVDDNNCPLRYEVEVEAKPLPAINFPQDTFFCRGGAPLQLEFGDQFDSYLWSDGTTGSGITVFFTQTVSLTVRDSFGCMASDSVFAESVPPPNTFVQGDRIICEGGSTELTVADTTLMYRWSTGATTRSIVVTEANTYYVQVQDSFSGCNNFYIVQVRTASPFKVDLTGDLSICPGETTMLGVEGSYRAYQWSTGSTEPELATNRAGLYQVTVNDQRGCTGTGEVRVQSLLTPELQLPDTLSFCRDSSIALESDNLFEQYRWSDGVSTLNRSFSLPGNYILEAAHSNGCVVSDTIRVLGLDPPTGQIIGDTLLCANDQNTLFVSGDFASIRWSTGASDPSIGVTQAGQYAVTVTDDNQCRNTFFIAVTDVNALPPDPVIADPGGICPGAEAELRTEQVYTRYLWSNGQRTPSIRIRESGTYALTVTDEFGCSGTTRIELNTFALSPLGLEDTIVFCSDTRVALDAGGPYASWKWSNGYSGAVLETDTAGNYRVTIADLNGCLQEDSVQLIQLESVLPILDDTLRVCPGDLVILDAGNGFATYNWSTGDTDRFTSASVPGLYTVNLTDTNGCDVRDSTRIVQYVLNDPVMIQDAPLCSGGTTLLRLQDAYVSYVWSTGDTAGQITISSSGTYSVSLTDRNTCNQEADIDVNALPAPALELPQTAVLDCHDGSLTLQPRYDPGNFDFFWSGPGITPEQQNQEQPVVFAEGRYTLQLQDRNTGCYSDTVSVEVAAPRQKPQIQLSVGQQLDCNTSEVGIRAEESSRGAAFTLRWYNQDRLFLESEQGYSLQVSSPGMYYFELTNAEENCTVTDSIAVLANYTPPIADAGSSATLNCRIATVNLDGSGSDQGNRYRYKWQTNTGKIISGGTTLAPLIGQPGWYYLEVVNTENGCQQRDSVWVAADFSAPHAVAGSDVFLDCFDEGIRLQGSVLADGREVATTWRSVEGHVITPPTQLHPLVYQAGQYILLAENTENGCTDRDTVQVFPPENPPVGLVLDARPPICFGDKNGLISVTAVQQGTEPFLFSLNGKPYLQTSSFSNLSPGNYTLAVQDSKGCSYEEEIQLGYGRDNNIDLGPDQEVRLGTSVSIFAAINFAEEEIATISWSASDGNLPCSDCLETAFTPLETMQLGVSITDIFGCTASDQLTLIVQKPASLYVPSAFSPDGDGLNDRLMVYAGNDVARIGMFRILDRWGEQIFMASDFLPNDPAFAWDGTFRGQVLQPGIFVYVLEVLYIDGKRKVFSGDVSLMR